MSIQYKLKFPARYSIVYFSISALCVLLLVCSAPFIVQAQESPKKSAKIEKELREFYKSELEGIDLTSDIQCPKTAEQKMDEAFAATKIVYSLGKDVAMVATFGKSEVMVQIARKGVSGKQLIDLVNPGKAGAISAVKIGTDALQKIEKGKPVKDVATELASSAGKEYIKSQTIGNIPVVRTGVAFYNYDQVTDKHQERIEKLVKHNKRLLKLGKLSSSYTRLQKMIDNTKLASKKKNKEYNRVLQHLVGRYAKCLIYKDTVMGAYRVTLQGFKNDVWSMLSELDGTYGQGTERDAGFRNKNYGVGRAFDRYIKEKAKWEKVENQLYGLAKRTAPKYRDYKPKAKELLKRYHGKMQELRKQYNKYDSPDKNRPPFKYPHICMCTGSMVTKVKPEIDTTMGQGTQVPDFVKNKNNQISFKNVNIKTKSEPDYIPCSMYTSDTEKAGKNARSILAVVDSSGSMSSTDPNNLRIKAIQMMIDTMSPDTTLGLVDFDSGSRVLSSPLKINRFQSNTRQKLRNKIQMIDSNGGTDIQNGLKKAEGLIDKKQQRTSIVLLTDGKDDTWKGKAGIIPENVPVHTIALSNQADRRSLSKISAATGGIADIARTANDLPRIMSRLFGQASGEEVLLSREGTIKQGEKIDYGFFVGDPSSRLQCQVSWPGSDVDIVLKSPNGRTYSTKDAVNKGFGVESSTYDIVRLDKPVAGRWTLQLLGRNIPSQKGEAFTARVSSQGGKIETKWKTKQVVPEAGQKFSVDIVSKNSTVNWDKAYLKVKEPSGKIRNETVSLSSIAAALGGTSGVSAARVRPDEPGLYRVQVTVFGETDKQNKIMRSFDRTFQVAPKGKGIDYKNEIKPFIRRRPGMLR